MGRALLAGGTRRRYWSPIRRVVEADVGRTALLAEAAAADGRAAWLDGFLARGDGLDSALSAPVVVELEPLPESGSPGRSGGVNYGSYVRRRRRPPYNAASSRVAFGVLASVALIACPCGPAIGSRSGSHSDPACDPEPTALSPMPLNIEGGGVYWP
jgi:hypothetical protein